MHDKKLTTSRLSDVFIAGSGYEHVLAKLGSKDLANQPDLKDLQIAKLSDDIFAGKTTDFSLTPAGISFHFSQGDIGPFVAGRITATVPFAALV